MATKKKKSLKVVRPTAMTRKQLSRYQRERKQQRLLIGLVASVALVTVAILVLGLWREVWAKGDEPLAIVDGQAISVTTYAKALGYQQYPLTGQLQQITAFLAQMPQDDQQRPLLEFQQQILRQRLLFSENETYQRLIEDKFIAREAERRGVSINPQEMDEAIVQEFSAPSLPASVVITTSQGITVAPGASTKSLEEAKHDLHTLLSQTNLMSEAEYRDLILIPRLKRAKLANLLAQEVSPVAQQVHASHILVDTEEAAKEVRVRLEKGEEFEALAAELSQDEANKDKGGDLGWFPRGMMVPPFDDVAFRLEPGQLSDPVETQYGFHIIRVEEKDEQRPLTEEQLKQRQEAALGDWLQEQMASSANSVQSFYSNDKVEWARQFIADRLAAGSRAAGQ